METNKIIQGDCLEVMKTLPSESVDCVMTSPPYWALRDYGTASWEGGNPECEHLVGRASRGGLSEFQKGNEGSFGDEAIRTGEKCPHCGAVRKDLQLGLEPTFNEYIKKLCDIFDEVKRVLKKEGTCWVNIGDTYSGSGGAGGDYNEGGLKEGQPTYKQSKINYPDKSLVMIPFRFALEMVNRGWILRNTIIWQKPNCMPSSVKDRFTVDFEYLFFFAKSKKYFFETQYEPLAESSLLDPRIDKGLVLHKSGKAIMKENQAGMKGCCINSYGRNKRAVWTICPRPFKEAHFAVYPEELCETPLKAGCPEFVCKKCGKAREKILEPTVEYSKFLGQSWHDHSNDAEAGFGQQTRGFSSRKGNVTGIKRYNEKGYSVCDCNAGFESGIVLDPFFGSGTTGLVALKQNKKFIGIELNPKYIEIAQKRLKPYLEQTKL